MFDLVTSMQPCPFPLLERQGHTGGVRQGSLVNRENPEWQILGRKGRRGLGILKTPTYGMRPNSNLGRP